MKIEKTIKRNEPMPSMCSLCSSMSKISKCRNVVTDIAEENICFSKRDVSQYNEDIQKFILEYKPFTNSKRTISTICDNFSHIKSIRYS